MSDARSSLAALTDLTLALNSGVTIKTRKRNIVIPVDPGSFAAAIVQIIQDASEDGSTIDEKLEAAAKSLDGDNKGLEFSRYSDTLFEVFFAGGMLAPGGKVEGDSKLDINVSRLWETCVSC